MSTVVDGAGPSFAYGQLNPFALTYIPSVTSAMLTDDPMAYVRKQFGDMLSPDNFKSVKTWKAVVLYRHRQNTENSIWGRLMGNALGTSTGERPRFICMIPELHFWLPDPFGISDRGHLLNVLKRFPIYSPDEEDYDPKLRQAGVGSIINVEFADAAFRHGVVKNVIKINSNPPGTLGNLASSAQEAFTEGDTQAAGAPAAGTTDPSQYSGGESSSITGISLASPNVRLEEINADMRAFLQLLGATALELGYPPVVLTSGYRDASDQVRVMAANYKKYGFDDPGSAISALNPPRTELSVRDASHETGRAYLVGLYSDDTMANSIADIFERNWTSSGVSSAGVRDAAEYWKGKYGASNNSHGHLSATGAKDSLSVDLRILRTEGVDEALTSTLMQVGQAYEIFLLRENDHYHIQYKSAPGAAVEFLGSEDAPQGTDDDYFADPFADPYDYAVY